MDYETVTLRKEDQIATLTLNRPEKLNAVNPQMIQELLSALDEVARDGGVRVLVLTGAGRAFCAGIDLTADRAPSDETPETFRQYLRQGVQKVTLALHGLEIPSIASVNGAAVGLGFDWALACDIRIGSENARFMVAYTKLGAFPSTGGTYLMPRLMGLAKACEYVFTGDFLEAQKAERLGVLNRLVAADNLEEETIQLAQKIAKGPPIALKLAKLQMYKGLEIDNLPLALEFVAAAEAMPHFSEDWKEGLRAFAEKREPHFNGK